MDRDLADRLLDDLPGPPLEGFRREVLLAVMAGDLAWRRVESIPCATGQLDGLVAEGLIDVWSDHVDGPHVTLSCATARALGVVMECRPRVVYAVPEDADPDEPEPMRFLDEPERWELAANLRPALMPRVAGFMQLDFPDAIAVTRNPIVEVRRDGPDPRWAMLKDMHERLRTKRPKKRKKKKGRRR